MRSRCNSYGLLNWRNFLGQRSAETELFRYLQYSFLRSFRAGDPKPPRNYIGWWSKDSRCWTGWLLQMKSLWGFNKMDEQNNLPQSKNLPPTQGMFISHSTILNPLPMNLEVSEGRRFTGHHGRADATAALHLAPWNWGTGWISEGLFSGNLLQFAIEHGHKNHGFSHEKMWFSIVTGQFTRGWWWFGMMDDGIWWGISSNYKLQIVTPPCWNQELRTPQSKREIWKIWLRPINQSATDFETIYIYWLVVWNTFFHISGTLIPTDELIFFRGVGSTTNQFNNMIYTRMICCCENGDAHKIWQLWTD